MRLIHAAPITATLLLAACGGGADTNGDGAVSSEEVVAEAADVIKPEPGQYRTSYEVVEFDVPGAPEAMKQQMQAQMGGAGAAAREMTYCLTPEEAAANGPEQMAKNMARGNCTVARFDVSGGTLSADMQCASPDGTTSHVVMEGQMTSTRSTITMTNAMDMKGIGTMNMKTKVTSERIGDCPA